MPVLSAAVPMRSLPITDAFFVEGLLLHPARRERSPKRPARVTFPAFFGLTVVLSAIIIAVNLLADVLIAIIDPCVRERL